MLQVLSVLDSLNVSSIRFVAEVHKYFLFFSVVDAAHLWLHRHTVDFYILIKEINFYSSRWTFQRINVVLFVTDQLVVDSKYNL